MATSPSFATTVNTAGLTLNNASGTSGSTLFTPGSSGSVVEAISITSTDTTSRIVIFYVTISATDYVIGRITLPAATASIPTVVANGLDTSVLTYVNPNDPKLVLKNGAVLKAKMEATITSGKQVDIVVYGGDF
jgi:hypothetical protein